MPPDMQQASQLAWWQWLLLAAVLLCQGILIFRDAQKRGAKAWLWGLYGLTSVPSAGLVYYFCVVYRNRKKESGHISPTE